MMSMRRRGLSTAHRLPRVLVLGSGWGGNKVARELDKSKFDVRLASPGAPGITGVAAAAVWKGAYWTKQLSWANMMLIPMYWFKTLMFGRDISRF